MPVQKTRCRCSLRSHQFRATGPDPIQYRVLQGLDGDDQIASFRLRDVNCADVFELVSLAMHAIESDGNGIVDTGGMGQELEEKLAVSLPCGRSIVIGAQRSQCQVVCSSIGELIPHFHRIALQGGAGEVAARQIQQPMNFGGGGRFRLERAGALKVFQVLTWPTGGGHLRRRSEKSSGGPARG